MAGTAKAYNADKIILGPSDLWLNVALPGAGARLTVAADLTPDATANPNAIHLGMTAAGCTFTYKPEIQNMGSDELTSFHLSRIITESAMIKGNFLQVFDWSLLEKMTVGGTKTINTSTTSGFHQMQIGGLSAITTFPIALIGPDIAAPTLYWVIHLYKTFNAAGIEFNVTRKDQSSAPFEFTGQAIPTRATGDQIGNVWRSLVVGA